MRFTVATCNLKTTGGSKHAQVPLPSARVELLRTVLARKPAVIAVQELTPGYAAALTGVHHSLTLRPPGPFDGGNRVLGVGLLVSEYVQIEGLRLIDRAPFPERTLAADVTIGGQSIHIVAFHSLTGVDYGKAKAAQFSAIVEHLHAVHGHVVLMGDANEPQVDARDLANTKIWHGNGSGAELLFGPSPAHRLRDAWRVHLGKDIAALPDEGPLALSYRTGKTARRYDHIFVPHLWQVLEMTYDYDSALAAGSDHALLSATVDTTPSADVLLANPACPSG